MPQPDQASTDGGRAGLITAAVIAAICLVLALVATGLWLGERHQASDVRADRASQAELDAAYQDTAVNVMTKLMTIRQETLSEDVDEIVGLIEGDFSEQFAPRRDSYEDVVTTTTFVADGVVSPEDLDKTVAAGLGLRWSFLGPFATIDLNAPGGVADYGARYGGFYRSLAADPAPPSVWEADTLARIVAAWDGGPDPDPAETRARRRDARLAALMAHKRAQR